MLAGAFAAVIGSDISGNPWVGVLFAILVGILISAIHAVLTVTWGANQGVSSMALVLLAEGACGLALQSVYNQMGSTPQVANLPSTSFLNRIPIFGGFFGGLSPFVYLAFLALILVQLLFKYTRYGLRITAVGEN